MTGPVVVALAIRDAILADRMAALLADVPGLRLAACGEPADVTVVSDTAAPAGRLSDELVGLMPREAEVLALLAEGAFNKLVARRLGFSVHTA